MAEKKRYVEAADFVRALTIASVVAVHSTWYMADGAHWVSSGAILSLLHYTRESFMALTGFVLTYSLFGKQLKWKAVWIKRYKLVLFPYMIWSAGYMLLFGTFAGVGVFFITYGKNLLDGGAWFHLYYLLITMQFYLVLPLFLRLMRVAKKHPIAVVVGAIIFQLALMAYDQYGVGPHPTFINRYTGDEVWTYTVFFVVGGVAALYWEQVREWLKTHFGTVLWLSAATAALMEAEFFVQTYLGHNMTKADSVLQPAMIPWAIMIIALLAAIGVRYEAARWASPGRWPVIKWLADLSFGIYLGHPMLLQLWTNLLAAHNFYHPSFLTDAITVAVLIAGTGFAVWLISLTPVSTWLIGRAKVHGRSKAVRTEQSSVAGRLQES
ncbi:acyltransferase family protein [Sulfobacillus harzensis]|uniref:Acyltransferase n=1 Tax=Sulfobacillus harzensis TaxID=2729629 RepID=A0A7Y0Q4U9_9FIRM|nr:acyltransferase [Sulfobacillus harzensis]